MKRLRLGSIARYASAHRRISIFVLLAAIAVLGFGGWYAYDTYNEAKTVANANQSEEVEELSEASDLEDNTEELARLDVTQDAIENTDPVSRANGQCSGMSIYVDDGNGLFSVSSRLADGSWQCVTYNLKNLQDYVSEDGKSRIKVDVDDQGTKTVIVESTDETGSKTTTKSVTNPDGSGHSTTEGGYGKVVIGPTNDGRQIFGFFDYSDDRYYTDIGRFQSCFLTQNFYDYSDGMSYFDGTYRELGASEKAAQAAVDNCQRLPKVQYEPANYNLPLLKKCLREGQSAASFDTATCYRKASG